jgi:hypothetical protein
MTPADTDDGGAPGAPTDASLPALPATGPVLDPLPGDVATLDDATVSRIDRTIEAPPR